MKMPDPLYQKISKLPKTPGVYIFKNKQGQPIYIGKALNIRRRVRSHFQQKPEEFGYKQSFMLPQIRDTDYIEVRSEIEALLLEANLIKNHKPKYNSRLKDDKSYLYIKITTGEDFPEVLTARLTDIKSSKRNILTKQVRDEKLSKISYFGPFPSAKTVRDTLKSLRRIFPYCNCNFKVCHKKKSCLWCEIGLDAGPCIGLISKEEYRQIIHRLILLLQGKKEKLIKEMEWEMALAAKHEEFEKAQLLKKQIAGIEYLTRPTTHPQIYLENPEYLAEKRKVGLLELKKILSLPKTPVRIECFDISNIHGKEATGSMVVFQNGQANKSQYRRFKIRLEGKPNDVAMMNEVIGRRLKHAEWLTPDLIVVDGGKGQVAGAIEVLNEADLTIPVIGLAKRMEEIIIPGGQDDKMIRKQEFKVLRLPGDSAALHILQALRDEAHRFALAYHRKLHLKVSLG